MPIKAATQDTLCYTWEACYKLTTESAKEEEELQLDQEEADTHLLLHARHATKEPFNAIVISSEDTDVRILRLAFSNDVKVPLFHRCVSQQMARYIDIGKIASAIGLQVCKALLGLHAFTGCDSVSSFAGIGKVKPLKILRKRTMNSRKCLQDLERGGQ